MWKSRFGCKPNLPGLGSERFLKETSRSPRRIRFGCKPNLPALGPNRVEEVFEGFKVCVEKPVRLQTEPTGPGSETVLKETSRSPRRIRFGCKPNLPTLGPNRVEEVFEGYEVCVEKPVRLQTEPTNPGTEQG